MNRDQAYTLIRQTFTQGFDRSRFSTLAVNLLNRIDESKAQSWNKQYIKDAFKDHVHRYERLGTYTSPDGEKLDVLIVYLTEGSKLERARTAIRNFVAHHLKTRDEKDAALVAFVSPTEKQWRFSYVKMEYATVEKDSGKIGVEERLTPARRFSYLVGEGESCHTAQTRFLGLLQNMHVDPKFADIENAFSVEAVTKEFFTRYVQLFGEIHKALEKILEKDRVLQTEFAAKNINPVDFAKKLMGQVVFLYFLQKKGWLGVAKGQGWGTGPRDFLRRLANGEYRKYGNFFNDILEPLFYDTLATDRGHDAWCTHFTCRIPFLNGGLFEPLGNYDWRNTDICLPNRLFTNDDSVEEGITGTGVLDVFDRYNFTVNEAEPLEKEVAIDPEMLGKVFENLIEENRRKGLGAYYTPREIVHYMCQESLINYLDTALNKDKETVPRKDIETFVHLGDQAAHYEAARLSGTKSYTPELPGSIETHARLIDEKLTDITVCDPAVGSGAFPVGMMTEIVRTRSALTPYFNDIYERTPYHFKRHAIQNCLYGVDIDPGAVEIAKLRLWLSLVVDEEDVQQIKPLPNLDYKVVAGNSLLGVERNIFNDAIFQELEKLKPQYFDETDPNKKTSLKQQIDDLIHQLTNGKEIFDFEIYFSEVFHRKGGFDVVIANPPYIGEKGNEKLFHIVQACDIGRRYYSRWMDYFYYFFHKAIDIAKLNGLISFITTNYYLTATGAKKLRADFKDRTSIHNLINFNELKIFESAQGQHNIITNLQKSNKTKVIARNCITRRHGFDSQNVLNEILLGRDTETEYYEISQAELYEKNDCQIRIAGSGVTSNTLYHDILNRIKDQSIPLGNICNIIMGLVSRADRVSNNHFLIDPNLKASKGDGIFVLTNDELADLDLSENDKNRFVRPFYKNSDIKRYYSKSKNDMWILYIKDIGEPITLPLGLKIHFEKYKTLLTKLKENFLKNEIAAGFVKRWLKNGNYFVLFNPKEEYYFTQSKIIAPYRSQTNSFTYNKLPWFASQDVCYIWPKSTEIDLKYLLSFLNSKLCLYWLLNKGKRKGKIIEFYQKPLSEVPIRKIAEPDQNLFIKFVDEILSIVQSVDYLKNIEKQAQAAALEREIDRLVYELYGLTEEEIAIVEGTSF